MLALRIDEPALARIAPDALRDLHEMCRTCESREQCAVGLVDDFADVAWHQYCPSASILNELGELPWFRAASV